MSKSEREHTAQDEARELYEHRHDEDEWEDEPEPIEVRPSRSSMLSIRLPRDVFEALTQAAEQKGENLSEYVRKAIMYRIQTSGVRIVTVLNSSIGSPGAPLQTEDRRVWTEPTRATTTSETVQAAR